jgi:hypothetical protein
MPLLPSRGVVSKNFSGIEGYEMITQDIRKGTCQII